MEVLQEAELATPGVVESFLNASHVTRTRHAHQVSASSLYISLKKAYDAYVTSNTEVSAENFSAWCARRRSESPQFLYWHMSLELELLVLSFVLSLLTGDFELYMDALAKVTP